MFREYFASTPATKLTSVGLFGIKGLLSPNGLTQFAQTSLLRAQSLANELRRPSYAAVKPGSQEIMKLDELSDTLCKAVDMAAFLRISHPSSKMADAAQKVHELLFGFMNELNTSSTLFKLVQEALDNPEVQGESRKVGEILLHDFLKSGIQFDSDPQRQRKFVDLSNDISINGQSFLMRCGEVSVQNLVFKPSELGGVSPTLLAKLSVSRKGATSLLKNQVVVPGDQPHIAEHILSTATNGKTRRKVWHYLRNVPDQQIHTLDQVLKDRHALSQLAGYDNYANYELSDKMMQSTLHVNAFLTSLATTVAPLAINELSQLSKLDKPMAPWDYSFCLSEHRSQLRNILTPPEFEIHAVFSAISDLVEKLYGLRFLPGDVELGEVWAPEVKRLDVYDQMEKVGTIYCDLLSRPGKQPNPAHFTIQCSRRLPNGEKQLPIIALVCDFVEQKGSKAVTLQYHEVQTLFHEVGHAIHSMVGRTDLHNVSGTRCATDFVELPSILFEKFASHPQVLAKMKPELDVQRFLQKQAKIDKSTLYWETWHQICLSFLDQNLHGSEFSRLKDSQAVANNVAAQCSLFTDTPMNEQFTRQYAHFGHLISYGATYYSYLLDRCLAAMTWELLFTDPHKWEEGGHKFKDEILKWGGSKDPRACIEALFGKEFNHQEIATSLTLN